MALTPINKKRSLSGECSYDAPAEQAPPSTNANSKSLALSSKKRIKHESFNSVNRSPGGQNVRVVARVRPLSTKEVNESSKEAISVVPSLDRSTTIKINATLGARGGSNSSPKSFDYDGAFGPNTSQQDFYEHTVGDMIRSNIYKGFNVTVMAYGQTGSGKTFTMGTEGGAAKPDAMVSAETTTASSFPGPAASDGIIPRAVFDLFDQRRSMVHGEERVTIEMSYLEIYNEEPTDLLVREPTATLQIRDSPTEGVIIQNLSTRVVACPHDVCALMNEAATRRATASTAMNAVSSRSHAICTLHVTIAPLNTVTGTGEHELQLQSAADDEATAEMRAKLTLVDLAGSERIKRTGAEGQRMKEGISINKGLFVLGQCVSALAELGQQGKSAAQSNCHVPYRSSKLTRILQDSLGGNSRTIMIACISPADTNVEETVNTLRYAQRTRSIQNSAVRNVVASSIMSAAEAAALKQENEQLKLQLVHAQELLKIKPMVVGVNEGFSNLYGVDGSNLQQGKKKHDKMINKNAATAAGVEFHKNHELRQTITHMHSTISSLKSKIDFLEQQNESMADDALEASIRADKWELRCEQVESAAKTQGVTLNVSDSILNEANESGSDLVTQLRKEVASLKSDLHDAFADAAMARATAAAIVASNGDLNATAENWASKNTENDNGCADPSDIDVAFNARAVETLIAQEKEEKLALTAELVAVSGGIEAKEAMAVQMNKERECMEAMRFHFEHAVKSLNDEVDALAAERSGLLAKVEEGGSSTNAATTNDDLQETQRMKARINELELRIKDLRQKAAEHSKSLRLREIAEKKCALLAAEIMVDKKRRIALQKQLKEQATERRTEKMAAKKEAAKLLRDSNRLKVELQKVKDAAAKQSVVLQRKVTEAMNRQKRASEMMAKKQQQNEERKQLAAVRAAKINRMVSSSLTSSSPFGRPLDVEDDRREELFAWLDREIDSASVLAGLRDKIMEHKTLLSEAIEKKKAQLKLHTFNRSSGNISVNPPSISPALKALDEEIEMRSKLIDDLEVSVKVVNEAAVLSPRKELTAGSPGIVDTSFLEGLSGAEAKAVFSKCFQHLLRLKKESESVEAMREECAAIAVNVALTKARRSHEETIMQLKMEHSQAMMDLLNSTSGTIQQSVRLTSLNSVVDADFQASVEQMLSGYLEECNKAKQTVHEELKEVKEAQEGMKQIVESVATDIIQKTRVSKPKCNNKEKPSSRNSIDSVNSLLEEIDILEADEAEEDNSDDSDWSPNRHKTPGPKRRSRKSDSACKENNPRKSSALIMEEAAAASAAAAAALDRLVEHVSGDETDINQSGEITQLAFSVPISPHAPRRKEETGPYSETSHDDPVDNEKDVIVAAAAGLRGVQYEKLKVKELKEMLRSRSLPVSGNKSELIGRLQDNDNEASAKPKKRTAFADLTNEDAQHLAFNSKENRRSSTRTARGGRGSLQDINVNKLDPSAKGQLKSKLVLPSTPPMSSKKGIALSSKKVASVRRSTMFNRNVRRVPSFSPPLVRDDNNNQENLRIAALATNPKPRGENQARRNLGNQLSKARSTNSGKGTSDRPLQQLELPRWNN